MAISFNKEVILYEQYFGKIREDILADFIHKHFEKAFEISNNLKDKLFHQHDDPSQNSRNANNTMYKLEAKNLRIPARSLDINLIENVFNYVRRK